MYKIYIKYILNIYKIYIKIHTLSYTLLYIYIYIYIYIKHVKLRTLNCVKWAKK